MLGAAARAGVPAATLAWQAPGEPAVRSLLLVLEQGAEGWRLLDERVAEIAPKARRSDQFEEGPLFALVGADGRPLAVGWLAVPDALHGPVEDADGTMRCIAHPLERKVLAVRLPLPTGATELRLLRAAEHAPDSVDELVAALSARPSDAGLELESRFVLASEPRP